MRDDAQLAALMALDVRQKGPDLKDVAGMTMKDLAVILRDARDSNGNVALRIGLELTLNDGFTCEFIMKRKGTR